METVNGMSNGEPASGPCHTHALDINFEQTEDLSPACITTIFFGMV